MRADSASHLSRSITDNDRFRAIFALPDSEQLLADCAMAMEAAGSTHTGRFYLSTGWLCFSSVALTVRIFHCGQMCGI